MLLLSILTLMICTRRRTRQHSRPQHAPIIRRAPAAPARQTKSNRKPGWVITEVLRLLATTRGQAGCRTVAAMFNARFAFRGESVSKSYVAQLRNKHRYAILQLRKKLRQPPKPGKPNQTWALDWTNVTINKETHILLGVIDHGSRQLLALKFADKSAAHVIKLLRQLITAFRKPKSIRTDNDGAFVSLSFAIALQKLGIKHQRSPPHSPWQNGRIERFFGTFKRAISQIRISSKA
jgi:putative transposase